MQLMEVLVDTRLVEPWGVENGAISLPAKLGERFRFRAWETALHHWEWFEPGSIADSCMLRMYQ